MRVLIFGISGQDGHYMAEYLMNNYENVVICGTYTNIDNVDIILREKIDNLAELDFYDLDKLKLVIDLFQPDFIFNFAGESIVNTNHPLQHYINLNVLSVDVILKTMKPNCRFLNAGSVEEFSGINYYSISKRAARDLIKNNKNSVQPYMWHHESPRRKSSFFTKKIISWVVEVKRKLEEKNYDFSPLKIGNINVLKNFSYAPDFMPILWEIINHKYLKSGDFYLCGNSSIMLKDFITLCFKQAGMDGEWKYEDFFFVNKYNGEDINNIIAIKVDDGIKRLEESYYANYAPYKKVNTDLNQLIDILLKAELDKQQNEL